MSAPAAFEATYFTHKPIVTRGVVQIVLEIPAEKLLPVLSMLQPKPGEQQVQVAIARLDPAREAAPTEQPKERKAWADLPPSQQAAIRCGEPEFRDFLAQKYGVSEMSETTADMIRRVCIVESRRDLDTNHKARVFWHQLDTEYLQATGRMARG